jgi:prepilin-type N-terminal cleavage/methylation domain-containing protein
MALIKTRRNITPAQKNQLGFTMIELLIVASIVSLFSVLGFVGFQSSVSKSRDASRKDDLQRIKVAFEDYYSDNDCYPTAGSLNICGSSELQPYLQRVPCDPITDEPYLYTPLANACSGYRVHAALENDQDNSIEEVGCDQQTGCGYFTDYNYGVSVGVTVYDPNGTAAQNGGDPSPSPSGQQSSPVPTPSPSGPIYEYACDSSGVCNRFEQGHPFLLTCPVTYQATNCNNECAIPAVQCGG